MFCYPVVLNCISAFLQSAAEQCSVSRSCVPDYPATQSGRLSPPIPTQSRLIPRLRRQSFPPEYRRQRTQLYSLVLKISTEKKSTLYDRCKLIFSQTNSHFQISEVCSETKSSDKCVSKTEKSPFSILWRLMVSVWRHLSTPLQNLKKWDRLCHSSSILFSHSDNSNNPWIIYNAGAESFARIKSGQPMSKWSHFIPWNGPLYAKKHFVPFSWGWVKRPDGEGKGRLQYINRTPRPLFQR